jgi:hypothetical protein
MPGRREPTGIGERLSFYILVEQDSALKGYILVLKSKKICQESDERYI